MPHFFEISVAIISQTLFYFTMMVEVECFEYEVMQVHFESYFQDIFSGQMPSLIESFHGNFEVHESMNGSFYESFPWRVLFV